MDSNTKWSWILYGTGIIIVAGSHIYMLMAGLAPAQMVPHAIANLVAACLLGAGWFSRKA